ncbi:LR75A protein, partial [Polypterus senegalus]|nr:LR75A protein [Polypterus senegalus]
MGIKQTKGNGHSSPEAGVSPQHALGGWKRTPTKERGDIFTSLVLKSGDKFGKGGTPPPYQRRIGMIQEMLSLAKQGKQDEATELLKNLRQGAGYETVAGHIMEFINFLIAFHLVLVEKCQDVHISVS